MRAIKSKGQKQEILAAARAWNPKYYLMMRIGFTTGLRISDILRLKVLDVKGQYKTITEKKTRKKRIIDLRGLKRDMDTHIALFDLSEKDYLIFSRENAKDKPLSRVRAWQVMRELSHRHELEAIGTHTMRKTHAREYYIRCGDIVKVQRRLNHNFVSTTWRYLVDENDLKNLLRF
jgi:integrase